MTSSYKRNGAPKITGLFGDLRATPVGMGSIPGLALFMIGHILDAPLQYALFTRGWAGDMVAAIGLPVSGQWYQQVTAGPGFGGLGPIPSVIVGMSMLAGVRNAYWLLVTNNFEWSVPAVAQVLAYTYAASAFNTLLAVQVLASHPHPFLGWKQYVGMGLYVLGMTLAFVSEASRARFKKDPRNKGKIDDTGLWGVVRHPNYLGYLVWRSGVTLTAGSLPLTAGFIVFQLTLFHVGVLRGLHSWMAARYGAQWEEYKGRVPYGFLPGIV
ncbi:hypothetical protein C8J57DRAFT_1358905 [Mycena rebaudengoi]|nr:hypothetical protein C8J57DRAFT_1363067 [Mycena rebaudengoi]KAJ7247755.1 hypothetical protein C8J57DRAFT_1358905 [Mycena rebaudengoi]